MSSGCVIASLAPPARACTERWPILQRRHGQLGFRSVMLLLLGASSQYYQQPCPIFTASLATPLSHLFLPPTLTIFTGVVLVRSRETLTLGCGVWGDGLFLG